MTTVAIIPARGGSVRIKNKNRREFHGRPIIHYAIETARKSGLFDRIYVSTDDRDISVAAAEANAEVLWRPADDGTQGTQELARDILLEMPEVQYACVIYPCSPLVLPEDLILAREHVTHGSFLYAMSVGVDPLCDAGNFYFGRAAAFRIGTPLIGGATAMIAMPPERCVDINVEQDWQKAEQLYDALRRAA